VRGAAEVIFPPPRRHAPAHLSGAQIRPGGEGADLAAEAAVGEGTAGYLPQAPPWPLRRPAAMSSVAVMTARS
jgi:hypothetical protein